MDEHKQAVHEYFEALNALRKERTVREHSHFDIYGNNYIKVTEFDGDQPKRTIVNVSEEDSTDCYKRAAEQIRAILAKKKHPAVN